MKLKKIYQLGIIQITILKHIGSKNDPKIAQNVECHQGINFKEEEVERSFNGWRRIFHMIDYEKYLKCQDCKDSGLYCKKHRKEVEAILQEQSNS